MTFDTNTIISMTEATRDFSLAAQIADSHGQAVILKNNRPKYVLIDLDSTPYFDITEDEKIDIAAARILKKYHAAFEELAK